jgi:uncharacterized membrane protein YagU involved in acid resistance
MLKGAIAGVAATWLMNKATTFMYEREAEDARQREDEARSGGTAYANAAGRVASALDVELTDSQRTTAGTALHWILGTTAGAAYGVARSRWPAVARGGGVPFGVGFFLTMDELMNPLLGFTPGPQAFPWQAHARGLGGHVVFGLATEGVLQALDRLPSRSSECLPL